MVVVDFMRGHDVYGCAISSLFVWELWNARACSLENVPSLLGKIINFKTMFLPHLTLFLLSNRSSTTVRQHRPVTLSLNSFIPKHQQCNKQSFEG